MPSVYDSDAFSSRVSYARQCIIKRQMNGRAFFTCFEMCDGDAVATALVRKADQEPLLAKAIGERWLAELRTYAAKYAHVPTRQLPALARQLRNR